VQRVCCAVRGLLQQTRAQVPTRRAPSMPHWGGTSCPRPKIIASWPKRMHDMLKAAARGIMPNGWAA
jgi:hypothetical protein